MNPQSLNLYSYVKHNPQPGNRLAQTSSATAYASTAGGANACPATSGPSSWAQYNGTVNGTGNNQMSATTQNASQGQYYDASGNITNDGLNSYLYDGEGRICAVRQQIPGVGSAMTQYLYDADGNILTVDGGSTAQYLYDAFNRRVRAIVGGADTEFVFNQAGKRVSAWNGTTRAAVKGQYYWGSIPVAYYTASPSATHFQHQDWLGTERLRTAYSGGAEGAFASLPFGDAQTTVSGTDGDPYHYAALDYDSETNTGHAQFRQYSDAQGHWMAPDPYGGSYDMTNPQSFNRYAYVLNNPLSFIDPSGLVDDDLCGWTPTYAGGAFTGWWYYYCWDTSGGGGGGGGGGGTEAGGGGGGGSASGSSAATTCGPDGYRDATPAEQNAILGQARSEIGTPYRTGAGASSSPSSGFDCSGLVSFCINAAGVQFAYHATASLASSVSVRPIATAQMSPGDLMLFPGHVGFYDPGQSAVSPFLSATSHGVMYQKTQYWGNSFTALRVRVKCK